MAHGPIVLFLFLKASLKQFLQAVEHPHLFCGEIKIYLSGGTAFPTRLHACPGKTPSEDAVCPWLPPKCHAKTDQAVQMCRVLG